MRIVPALMLVLAACSQSNDVYEELPNSSLAGAPREVVPDSRIESTLARPVTIGEDGPRLDACGVMGQVTRAGGNGLALRAAPFAEAKSVATLAEGARLHVCTRSIDQKWLGVVVRPTPAEGDSAPPLDCGVSSPVDRKQAYEGPCASGWVASAYVRLIAG
ncbi:MULTISPECIES: hypothetical protein [Sphingobium]|jgi:hypothetical protein|uniref:hypothetical protein n=1 Tax=Sphingobium TaxID=165695 RepID=UPI000C540304|nr:MULTISPECIES: hypothetical protein [Sphingobium]MAP45312.1 hypothetical protein [Sphingobium sp.]MAX14828.1 hypothetical protein [Sphingobium sp.]MBS50395.1 hypothetical protein [Sphingobium sp.]MCC4256472.1 hypothetical protein [Sphingobium lactosutens]|tara:strand:+ start:940 stop:1422 length:483 start_codon:yes stop_codon:yes gene_type:complete